MHKNDLIFVTEKPNRKIKYVNGLHGIRFEA